LNGKKILVQGNHDKMSQDVLKNFTEVYGGLYRTNIEKQCVTFCHYCMVTWASSCHGSWLIYGHSHGRIKEFEDKFAFDCGVDVWNYTPISWDVVKYVMSRRIKKPFQDTFELDANVAVLKERNLQYIKEMSGNQ
jgi:calcineurin-like phosphoesterase family protein